MKTIDRASTLSYFNRNLSYLVIILLSSSVFLFNLIKLAAQPKSIFLNSVIYDDTVYYSQIARNVVNSGFFSFDGVHETNGFQPGWQVLTLGLAFIFEDHLTLLRSMSLLSGLLWMLGMNIISYTIQKKIGFVAGSLFGMGTLLNPMFISFASKGMETGLVAFAFAIALLSLSSFLRPYSSFRTKGLSVSLVFLFLSRVDLLMAFPFVLLAVILVKHFHKLPWRKTFVLCLRIFLFPMLVLFAYVSWNKIAFDNFLPVSGAVKSFYVQVNQFPESVFGMLMLTGRYLIDNTFFLIGRTFPTLLWDIFEVPINQDLIVNVTVCAVAALGFSILFRSSLAFISVRGPKVEQGFYVLAVGIIILFASLHFFVFVFKLPNFVLYGTWYFVPEYLALWLLVSFAINEAVKISSHKLRAKFGQSIDLSRSKFVLVLLTSTLIVSGSIQARPPYMDPRTSAFEKAGLWFEANYPGSRIGAFSSGILAFTAKSSQVTNLDGLVNSQDYLENYLIKNRLPNFIHQNRIQFISDYWSNDVLKHGVSWSGNIPLSELKVMRLWPIDENYTYVIFAVMRNTTSSQLNRGLVSGTDALFLKLSS